METFELKNIIESAWSRRKDLHPQSAEPELRAALAQVFSQLEVGRLRVATQERDGQWQTHHWVKQAISLSFCVNSSQHIAAHGQGFSSFFDKIPGKFSTHSEDDFIRGGYRVVPPAYVRSGVFIDKQVVLMPCFVNCGAHIGAGSLIDTWASVGSCAQIGKNVHLSGGAGIGGTLEPLSENPVIIEDDCFIGARSEIVEGVIVEKGSVLAMGVYISQSTRIYDRATGTIIKGRVPAGSVVVPGSLPSADGSCQIYAVIIVKHVDAQTRAKVAPNELLRID